MTYAEALDEALCYGWIDGHIRKYDALSWIHRFTPRRHKSAWSKINQKHVARLTKAGKMRAAGRRVVDAAKSDGRWQKAYDSPRTARPPRAFLVALKKNPEANAFYKTLNKSNQYAVCYRLQTAKKAETVERLIEKYVSLFAQGKKILP
jgi:uncharacterized protein YdeI (YjbR/CyaY-like superfamily)